LPWPRYSPDINPIENLWRIVKKSLKKINITTKVQLIENLIQIWHHDDEIENKCSVLIESMPRRIELLIKNKGMHTKYYFYIQLLNKCFGTQKTHYGLIIMF
jgi:hypothetical protein